VQVRFEVTMTIVVLSPVRVVSVVVTMFPLVRVLAIGVMYVTMSVHFTVITVPILITVPVHTAVSIFVMLLVHMRNVVLHLILM